MKTKNVITLMIFFSFSTLICRGQDAGFIPGIIAGTTFSTLHSEQIENSSKPGFVGGFNLIMRMGDKLDLLTEYTFVQKSINTKGKTYDYFSNTFSNTTTDYNLKINTTAWSVIANYYIKAPNLSLQAGGILGYTLLPTYTTDEDIYYGTSNVYEENIPLMNLVTGVKGFDFGLIMGISGGTEALRINLRYHLGLKDFYKKYNSSNDYHVTCNYIELSIAYSFLNVRVVR